MRERKVLQCVCERVAAGSDGDENNNNNNNSTELITASRGLQPAQTELPIDLYPACKTTENTTTTANDSSSTRRLEVQVQSVSVFINALII